MATFVKFHQFVEDKNHGLHNLSSHQLKVLLTDVAPDVATDQTTGDLTEISSGNGYPAGGLSITTTSSGQTGGVYTLVLADNDLTASGAVGPFRYAVLYNSSSSNRLIGYWDYGSSESLGNGDKFTLDLNQASGALQDS